MGLVKGERKGLQLGRQLKPQREELPRQRPGEHHGQLQSQQPCCWWSVPCPVFLGTMAGSYSKVSQSRGWSTKKDLPLVHKESSVDEYGG